MLPTGPREFPTLPPMVTPLTAMAPRVTSAAPCHLGEEKRHPVGIREGISERTSTLWHPCQGLQQLSRTQTLLPWTETPLHGLNHPSKS